MGSKILGKITASTDRPRGPDVEYRLSVPEDWIERGVTLELEMPRNLTCAACKGGGCDLCDRSGAVSLRGRKDPAELVEITMPRRDPAEPEAMTFTLRLPARGGLPPEGTELPRGNLLLAIRPGPVPERGVKRLAAPSIPPGEIPEVQDVASTAAPPRWVAPAIVFAVLVVLAWVIARFVTQ
jgi:hypothetical protein